jgi:asparagine synthase (glutamine-hydrolysing)
LGLCCFFVVSFALLQFLAARDPLGVTTLYHGMDDKKCMWFASELKAIKDECYTFATFPPGHYYTKEKGFVRYYNPGNGLNVL